MLALAMAQAIEQATGQTVLGSANTGHLHYIIYAYMPCQCLARQPYSRVYWLD